MDTDSLLDARRWESGLFIGSWEPATELGQVRNPATGEVLGSVGHARVADVDRAVEAAVAAQAQWASEPYDVRAKVLRRAGLLFEQHADEIGRWTALEAGAVLAMGRRSALVAAEECYEAAALAAMPCGEMLRTGQPRLSFARRRPVGVVGVIAPFNAPLLLASRAILPALAVGNAVVLKPDPRTAVCGGAIFAEILSAAGLPPGLLSVLPGDTPVGARLVEHPAVPVIAFTGSTDAGRAIATAAAQQLKRVHLELGGNSALVVRHDADLELAVAAGAFASFRHAGQICMAAGRHLVHESLYERYVARLAQVADGLVVGDPGDASTDIGPIIDERQRRRVAGLVDAARQAGASVVTGGAVDGPFYRPTVVADPQRLGATYTDEVFGPVATVTAFRDDDEAARLAGDSPYGLALGVISHDINAALALAERIPCGLVHINDQTINDEPVAPFGGVGDSGNGARHGGHAANLEAFTEVQWVTIRSTPPPYPTPPAARPAPDATPEETS